MDYDTQEELTKAFQAGLESGNGRFLAESIHEGMVSSFRSGLERGHTYFFSQGYDAGQSEGFGQGYDSGLLDGAAKMARAVVDTLATGYTETEVLSWLNGAE